MLLFMIKLTTFDYFHSMWWPLTSPCPPQATCSTNLASQSQTGTVSSKASTPSVAPPGDASSVARVWLSRASLNARLVVQAQVKEACICLCCVYYPTYPCTVRARGCLSCETLYYVNQSTSDTLLVKCFGSEHINIYDHVEKTNTYLSPLSEVLISW